MILSLRNNELYFKAFDGDKYRVSLNPTLKVNIHNDVVLKEINLTSIVTIGKIPDGVLTREEMRAVRAYFLEWPDSSEKRDACKVIDDALKVEHEKARDRAIMEMTEMYGCRRALTLSDMIRKRSFPFPAYYLREAGVKELLLFLLDEYPGTAGYCDEVPKTLPNTLNFAHRCGGSKCAAGVRRIIERHNLNATRCTAAFRAAHYIEKRNDPIIGR
jgi:hypothetical protein